MPYGALPLFASQGSREEALPPRWRYTYATTGEGEAYARPDFDDSSWNETAVPGQHQATEVHEAIWYRVHFPRPHGGPGRWLIRFGGAFQATTVWLNGVNLGQHYGYFSPFAFDISDGLLDDNLLVVCCQTPVDKTVAGKKQTLGVFNDWDCRPYPNSGRGQLPAAYTWWLPLGLWAPVTLVPAGDVVIQQVHYATQLEPDGSATVTVTARLANLSDAPVWGLLRTRLKPHSFAGADTTALGRGFDVGPHGTAEITMHLHVAAPRLWWPWTHGEPDLYAATAEVLVAGRVSAGDTIRLGLRTVEYRGETAGTGPAWLINGRPVFPKGSNYISEFRLDTCTHERHRADLQMMRDANMDMVRVHVHIEPDSFYQAADELGIMVICDSVLNGCYVFGAAPADRVFQEWAARDQVAKTIGFLYNHPSVVSWLIHNEPPWPEHCWWFGDPHTVQACRTVDLTCTVQARELDQTRPTITASGDKDTHTYGGWYHATWLAYKQETPRFVTEFGAQALPNLDSPFWATVETEWPVALTEPTWLHADFQGEMWDKYGVGRPEQYATLAEYVAASQQYQAWIARYGAERFRIQKWQPCGGVVHFMFCDGHPAITWSVVDYFRRPKAAYFALRDAFRPTHVCIDPVGEIRTDRVGRIIYTPGGQVAVDLWLVNDDPRVSGHAVLRWEIAGTDLRGAAAVQIPAFDAPALLVTHLSWPVPAAMSGELIITTALYQGDRLIERNTLPVLIRDGEAQQGESERARSGAVYS